jgi:hypothetical protein
MPTLNITLSESLLPRATAKPLAPTLSNAIAMLGTSKETVTARPTVTLATYGSFSDLCQALDTLDERFDRHLGVAVELPKLGRFERTRFDRVANRGGCLTIVTPQQGESQTPSEGIDEEIVGWDEVIECVSICEAVRRLLRPSEGEIKRCFVLRPEGEDPAPALRAVERYL